MGLKGFWSKEEIFKYRLGWVDKEALMSKMLILFMNNEFAKYDYNSYIVSEII